jgi:hypothetical protein
MRNFAVLLTAVIMLASCNDGAVYDSGTQFRTTASGIVTGVHDSYFIIVNVEDVYFAVESQPLPVHTKVQLEFTFRELDTGDFRLFGVSLLN